MADGFSEGDIVLVDFEAWTDEDVLFDTTRQEVAKEAGWDADVPLQPMPVLLGGGRLVPGFEDALFDAEIGKDGEVKVPPSKAFGEHDPERVRVYPRKEFEKADVDPVPGERIEMGNQRGTIVQATASRVRVDFNHPMAGRTLTYKYKVVEVADGDADRLKALIAIDYSVLRSEEFDVEVEGKTGRVVVPDEVMMDSRWFMAKHRLGHDIFEHTELDAVEMVETLTREEFESHGHGEHGHGHAGAAAAAAAGAGAEHPSEDEAEIVDEDGDDGLDEGGDEEE